MRIQVTHLGAVREADFALKPVTVFVGPNSTGKSWLAYMIGGVFGQHGWNMHLDDFARGTTTLPSDFMDDLVSQIKSRGRAALEVEFLATSLAPRYFRSVARSAQRWVPEYLGVSESALRDFRLEIDATDSLHFMSEALLRTELDYPIAGSSEGTEPLLQLAKDMGGSSLHLYTVGSDDPFTVLPEASIRRRIASEVFQLLHRAIHTDSYLFPTERTAYVAFPVMYNTSSDDLLGAPSRGSRGNEGKPMPLPLAEFLRWMGRTYAENSPRRSLEEKMPEICRYSELADLLEKRVLGGSVRSELREQGWRELRFDFGLPETVSIGSASSMVRELAPLVQYLRYAALGRDLLVIDEPEMNLHPAAQAAMAEFIAILANAGLRLVLTTHSPYIVDHLSNLMKAYRADPNGSRTDLFFLKDRRAYINPDEVGIRLLADGVSRDIMQEEHLIDWETFSSVADRLSEIYFDL